ncbi:MAG TPA: hypothetical protein VH138_10005 [Vicinamibacterales bacterium]|jgi:hypothetical protein|nr:hypothetical protein [Vicinamibacterales bacterium]
MRWKLVRLNALYIASVSLLVVIAMNPARSAAVLRGQARLVAHAVGNIIDSGAGTPIVAAPEPVSAPVSAQEKSRAVAKPDRYQVPIGTVVPARLRTPIDSSVNQVNDQVDAVLADAVTQDGVELIPMGSMLHGSILSVEAASRVTPLGQVSFAFAVVQHAQTGSRAAFVSRSISVEAQPPAEPAGKRRGARPQPTDVLLAAGHQLQVTLAQPLVVAIPKIR